MLSFLLKDFLTFSGQWPCFVEPQIPIVSAISGFIGYLEIMVYIKPIVSYLNWSGKHQDNSLKFLQHDLHYKWSHLVSWPQA